MLIFITLFDMVTVVIVWYTIQVTNRYGQYQEK